MTDQTNPLGAAQGSPKHMRLAEKYERILDRAKTMRRTSMEMRVFEDDMEIIIAALRAAQPPAAPVETKLTFEEVEACLPEHVTELARELASAALDDIEGEPYSEDRHYAVARWFDAALRVRRSSAETGEVDHCPTCDLTHVEHEKIIHKWCKDPFHQRATGGEKHRIRKFVVCGDCGFEEHCGERCPNAETSEAKLLELVNIFEAAYWKSWREHNGAEPGAARVAGAEALVKVLSAPPQGAPHTSEYLKGYAIGLHDGQVRKEIGDKTEAERADAMNQGLNDEAFRNAWSAFQNTPIDHVADSDDETCKCLSSAIRAFVRSIASRAQNFREALEEEEKYLHSLIPDTGSITSGDVEGAFHRLKEAYSLSRPNLGGGE